MQSCFMGIDIGTSSVRAVLFDQNGCSIAQDSMECGITAGIDGKAEMDPGEIVRCVFSVMKECTAHTPFGKSAVAGIGLSCQMHSLMAVDKKGKPLTPLMVWADTRAKGEAGRIGRSFDVQRLYETTGCRTEHPMYPLAKLLWLREHEPDIFKSAAKFITIKEYLIFVLYGTYLVDYTIAASQGYYNIHRQNWDEGILRDLLGVSKDRFGEVAECTQVLTGFKKEYEAVTGLCRDTPLVIGSGDGILANIGCGAFDASSMASTVGTSGAVRILVDRPLLDDRQRTWCYSFTKDKWAAGGAINNGGLALKWLRDTFRQQFEADAQRQGGSIYRLFDNYAAKIPVGSDGLIFLPYLTGERSPDWNADARGTIFGLDYSHGRGHIIRAAMEGVLYRLYSVYEALSKISGGIDRIIASGGYAGSEVWLQMQADLFCREVFVTGVAETSAFGAAYLAMCAVGAATLGETLPAMKPLRVLRPDPERSARYSESYRKAMELYGLLYPENGIHKSETDRNGGTVTWNKRG